MWLNLGVLPFWLVLLIFPQSQISKVFIASIFPILILSLSLWLICFICFLMKVMTFY